MVEAVGPTKRAGNRSEVTQSKILATAEEMFGIWGYDGISVRKIANKAGVELSLLLYHFKSKEGLYRAVFEKTAKTILAERHAALTAVIKDGKGRCFDIFMALCGYMLSRPFEGRMHIAHLLERTMVKHDEGQNSVIKEYIDPSSRIFMEALAIACPDADEESIHRSYHWFTGALLQMRMDEKRIERLSGSEVADVRKSMAILARMMCSFLGDTKND